MQQPRVSVIVPCWSVEKYLDKCMESIVNQTLHDIEIILVDDASPDRVPEMCDAWAQKDSRIKVIHKTKNEGLGMACNTGIDAATGEYIAFCDSDDWVDVDMYETMYDAAIEHQAQLVFTGIKRINAQGEISYMQLPTAKCHYQGREDVDKMMLSIIASEPSDSTERHIEMSAKVVLYSRNLMAKHNIYFESERNFISEDLLFNLDNLSHAESVVVLPNFFYHYYYNDLSLTTKFRKDRFEKNLTLKEELTSRYEFRELLDDFMTRVNRLFLGYARTDMLLLLKSKSISVKEKYNLFYEICKHPIWQQIKEQYPIKKMPATHRIVYECIKNKMFISLYLIAKLK